VTDLADKFDVILGDTWFRKHKAVLDIGRATVVCCSKVARGSRFGCPVRDSGVLTLLELFLLQVLLRAVLCRTVFCLLLLFRTALVAVWQRLRAACWVLRGLRRHLREGRRAL
jgi:hypothetical protein